MLSSILIGLDPFHDESDRLDFAIRVGKRTGATLVGLGVVDEPGIRATEPAWPVGGTPGVDPVYYRGYEGRLNDTNRQIEVIFERFASKCAQAGLDHFELKASGPPDEIITREAQTCDLIVLPRISRFRVATRDQASDDTIKRVLQNAPRPVVITPGKAYDSMGPTVVAYDGSLQAARALAAFQSTGLGESGRVHVLTMDSNSLDATRHADRAQIPPLSQDRGGTTRHAIVFRGGPGDPRGGSPPGRGPAGDGCLRTAGSARVLRRLRHSHNVEGMPRAGPLLPLGHQRHLPLRCPHASTQPDSPDDTPAGREVGSSCVSNS